VSCRELRFDRGDCIGGRYSESVRDRRFEGFKCQSKGCATFSRCVRSLNWTSGRQAQLRFDCIRVDNEIV